MRTFKLTLAYDGTAYAGWQVQPGQATVQGALEAAIERVTGRSVRVLASGRTDAGVHAAGQVVGFSADLTLEPGALLRALNAVLPEDVAVLDAVEVPAGFHPIRDALRKRYRYVIHDGPVRDVFERRYSWHYGRPLDEGAMHRAAQTLRGTHDFSSFETSGAPRESSVRTVSDIFVCRTGVRRAGDCPVFRPTDAENRRPGRDPAETVSDEPCRVATRPTGAGDPRATFLLIEVEADGFLYNMVRAIVGTLVEVGRGAEEEAWVGNVLVATDRRRAGPTAPPEGLCLIRVGYSPAEIP